MALIFEPGIRHLKRQMGVAAGIACLCTISLAYAVSRAALPPQQPTAELSAQRR